PPQALLLTSALATSTTQAAAWVPGPERVVGFGVLPPLKAEGMVEIAAGCNQQASLDASSSLCAAA
ncbi:MAG: hypothetical protein HC804_09930, partial [Anaerolineae bacterium]|nr:hypothetical protein [Anaerolineae bacterium]